MLSERSILCLADLSGVCRSGAAVCMITGMADSYSVS